MVKLLDLSADSLAANFGRRSFTFSHHLVDHPLTSLAALEELAAWLPAGDVEHNRGRVPAVVADGLVPRAEMTAVEIVRTIATNDCWAVLPVHHAPGYGPLLDELFDEVQAALPSSEGRIRDRQAVFFLASSGSTTPTHIDLEQGFLLHLRGAKTFTVGGFPDTLAGQRKVESFHTGGHRNVASTPADAVVFALEPGIGVHVPAFTPHLIHTGADEVALSLTIALRTDATIRTSAVHRANARMRRIGLKPRPPGDRSGSDQLKSRLLLAADRAVSATGRGRRRSAP